MVKGEMVEETVVKPTNTEDLLKDDNLPLSERLKLLQKKKQAELLANDSGSSENKEEAPPATALTTAEKKKRRRSKQESEPLKLSTPMANRKVEGSEKGLEKKSSNGVDSKLQNTTTNKKPTKAIIPESENDSNEVSTSVGGMEEEDEEGNGGYVADTDGTIKWTTLEHKGVFFPPPYQPHNIPLIYDGREIYLEPIAEEVATFFAQTIGSPHETNPVFRKNFFADFKELLSSINSAHKDVIKSMDKCDFSKLHQYLVEQRELKKGMSKEEKEKLKEEKKLIDAEYGICLWDGKEEKVGNFRVEPPSLFRGRGSHPLTGKIKTRVMPEDVTINIGPSATVPRPPAGHSWKRVVTDPTVTWLACWTSNVTGAQKYVILANTSTLKAKSDLSKFETARALHRIVDQIRQVNQQELRSREMLIRQRATALWFIDRLALRAGTEKGEDTADTVGCCSLRVEHVTLKAPNKVIFDFLGKDSIRYYNEVDVDSAIYKNIEIFRRPPKKGSDPLFDRLTSMSLNNFLSKQMPGLTAKVFRTYNASSTFQKELDKAEKCDNPSKMLLEYNRANRAVAILCNHQRAPPKSHEISMSKFSDTLLLLKYQRYLLRIRMKEVFDKDLKKECPEALEPEKGMTEEKILKGEQLWIDNQVEQANRKKEKAKKKADGDEVKEDEATEEPSPKKKKLTSADSGGLPTNRKSLLGRFATISKRIEQLNLKMIDKEENKTTSLGTSKTNYLDPRITFAWCKKHNVPVERVFPNTLRQKFTWAADVDVNWSFFPENEGKNA